MSELSATTDWRREVGLLRAKLDETIRERDTITQLALAVARLSLDCYQEPVIECLGCNQSMHEGAGRIIHRDCPLIALRTALGLDEHGFDIVGEREVGEVEGDC